MRGATAPRLLLEVVCARLLLPSASDAESALLQRVERIETRLDMSIPAPATAPAEAAPLPAAQPSRSPRRPEPKPAPQPTPAPADEPAPVPVVEPTPVPAAEPAAVPGELNAAAVRTMWPTVRDKVRQRSRTTEVMLAGATVLAIEGNTLVLTHSSAPLAKRLSEQRNADVIAEALKDALGVNWRVRCDTGGAVPVTSDPAPPPAGGRVSPPVPQASPAPTDVLAVVESGQQDDDEEHMLAEAGRADPQAPRRDPEEVALELLQNELGARRIDNG